MREYREYAGYRGFWEYKEYREYMEYGGYRLYRGLQSDIEGQGCHSGRLGLSPLKPDVGDIEVTEWCIRLRGTL